MKPQYHTNLLKWLCPKAGEYRVSRNGVHCAFIGIPGNAHQRRLIVRQLRRDGFTVEK